MYMSRVYYDFHTHLFFETSLRISLRSTLSDFMYILSKCKVNLVYFNMEKKYEANRIT